MKLRFATILCAASCALASRSIGQSTADQTDRPRPAQLFARNCAGCHVVPDPERAMDRAWISQLFDTA